LVFRPVSGESEMFAKAGPRTGSTRTGAERPSRRGDVTRVAVLDFEGVLKIGIGCPLDGTPSIEKVRGVTPEIGGRTRSRFKYAQVAMHPEPV